MSRIPGLHKVGDVTLKRGVVDCFDFDLADGFAPLQPAEFVIFRIGQKTADAGAAHTPEWTDHNAADPGVTLAEIPLFSVWDLFDG